MNLVLHESTKSQLSNYLAKPSHALLIEGRVGAGKGALARHIAVKLLGLDDVALNRYPFYQQIKPAKQTISIESIRQVQRFMRLKTVGSQQAIRRVLIIEDTQYMTIEAQNAFLKLLEEPPADTAIILTTNSQHALLPTIRSRVQMLNAITSTKAALDDFFSAQGFDETAINKAYHMSEGQVGLMQALLSEDNEHLLVVGIGQAKKLLSMSVFERLLMVDQFSKDRTAAEQLIDALQLVCHAALNQASKQQKLALVKRWHRAAKRLTLAQEQCRSNPNLKLLMTDLLISL